MNSNGRSTRIVIGTAMLLASVGLITCSGYLLISHEGIADEAISVNNVNNCKSFLIQSGASVKTVPDGIQAIWEADSEIESKVVRAAASLSECSMFVLKNFCAGADCSKPGVTFDLSSSSN